MSQWPLNILPRQTNDRATKRMGGEMRTELPVEPSQTAPDSIKTWNRNNPTPPMMFGEPLATAIHDLAHAIRVLAKSLSKEQ